MLEWVNENERQRDPSALERRGLGCRRCEWGRPLVRRSPCRRCVVHGHSWNGHFLDQVACQEPEIVTLHLPGETVVVGIDPAGVVGERHVRGPPLVDQRVAGVDRFDNCPVSPSARRSSASVRTDKSAMQRFSSLRK